MSRLVGAFKTASSESLDANSSVGLLEFLMPMPPTLKATITNGWSGPTPEWHTWRTENWGCAYDVAPESLQRVSPNELKLEFDSRYAPPLGALTHGAEKYQFRYRLLYCATGSQFAGIATASGNEEFPFTFDKHPADEGVPNEIIAEFGLEGIYEQVVEDQQE